MCPTGPKMPLGLGLHAHWNTSRILHSWACLAQMVPGRNYRVLAPSESSPGEGTTAYFPKNRRPGSRSSCYGDERWQRKRRKMSRRDAEAVDRHSVVNGMCSRAWVVVVVVVAARGSHPPFATALLNRLATTSACCIPCRRHSPRAEPRAHTCWKTSSWWMCLSSRALVAAFGPAHRARCCPAIQAATCKAARSRWSDFGRAGASRAVCRVHQCREASGG